MKKIGLLRRYSQVIAAVLYNCGLSGWVDGKIQRVPTKGLCVPGLNCYSCPSAVGACPLGSLQTALQQSRFSLPWYVLGTLILFGVLLGRVICGFLCPFGWLQDLMSKLPIKKIKKSRFTSALSKIKYGILICVIILPILINEPVFCKYICPAGTLEAGIPIVLLRPEFGNLIGGLFTWKVVILVICLILVSFVYRAFCRFICPLGALYSLFHRIAIIGMKVDKDKCIRCNHCISTCQVDIRHVGDRECISCTDCIDQCPTGAISFGVKNGKNGFQLIDITGQQSVTNKQC